MNKYKLSNKDCRLLGITVSLWIIIFAFLIATPIFIFQVLYLEPEPGSTYEKDILKALVCYICIPIIIGIISGLMSSFVYRFNKDEVYIENGVIHKIVNYSFGINNVIHYEVPISDIYKTNKFHFVGIIGRKELTIKTKHYFVDGKEINQKIKLPIIFILNKNEYLTFINMIQNKDYD